MTAVATPRDAATVVLLRAGERGPEVLMLRRHRESTFAADAWVFPGGAVDDADRRLDPALWSGINPEALAPRFAEPPDRVLGFHVAGVREVFEEAGLLLARHADGRLADPGTHAAQRMRAALAGGAASWPHWLAEQQLVLDLRALAYHARWVTPAQSRKRYDTCFFIAAAPPGQQAAHDRVETTEQCWLTPEQALARAAAGRMLLWHPTEQTLRELAACGDVATLLAHARADRRVEAIQPHIEQGPGGWRILDPDHPDYPRERYRAGGDLAPRTRRPP